MPTRIVSVYVEPLIIDPHQRQLDKMTRFARWGSGFHVKRLSVESANFLLQAQQAQYAMQRFGDQWTRLSMAFVDLKEPNTYRVVMTWEGTFYELFFRGEPGPGDFNAAVTRARGLEAKKRAGLGKSVESDAEIITKFWMSVSQSGCIPVSGTELYDRERRRHTFRMERVEVDVTAPVRESRMREIVGEKCSALLNPDVGIHRQIAAREVLHDRVEQHAAARKAADVQEPALSDLANAASDSAVPYEFRGPITQAEQLAMADEVVAKERQAFVITPERKAWLKARQLQLLKEWDNKDPNAPEGYYPRSARLHAEHELKEALAGYINLPGLSEVLITESNLDEQLAKRQERQMLDDDEPKFVTRRIITPTHLNAPKHEKGHFYVVVDSLHQMTTYIESFSHKPTDDEIIERFTRRKVRVPSAYWTVWIVHNNVKSKWKPGYKSALRLRTRKGEWIEFLLKELGPTNNEFFAACRIADADPMTAAILKSPGKKGSWWLSPLNGVSNTPKELIWNLTFDTPPHCSVSDKHTFHFSGSNKPTREDMEVAFKQADIDRVGQVCHLHKYDPRADQHYHEMIVVTDRRGKAYTVTMQQITADGRILRSSLKNYRGPVNDLEMQVFWNETVKPNTHIDCRIWRPSGDYCTWKPGTESVVMVRGNSEPQRSEWRKV